MITAGPRTFERGFVVSLMLFSSLHGHRRDMGGEPEIGVEHRAHHLHRVAPEREVVRNKQGHKPG